MTITLGHRWPMRSSLQPLNGLDALVKPTRQHVFTKIRSKPSQHFFSIIDLAKWAPRIKKVWIFVKWIPRTNEATRLLVMSLLCPLIKLKRILGFRARCLFGPGRRTWISSPKLVVTVGLRFCKSIFFVSSIWGRKWKVLLRIACQEWSQFYHK
jgi:hypothetical protein